MKTRTYIEKYPKKILALSDILENTTDAYDEVAECIRKLTEEGALVPLKASGLNGRRPSLYNRYKCNRPEKDYGEVHSRIRLLHPRFDHQYYLSHPEQYLAAQEDLEALSDFLWRRGSELERPMSINERSFSIFGKEKLLKSVEKQFSTYFRLPEFSFEELNTYATPEPFFEYLSPDQEDGAVLIIENKDTWYTLRKLMKEGHAFTLFGIALKVLLYGEGKKITRQSGRLREYQEEVLGEDQSEVYYFGDLDYEGISIYQEAKQKNPEVDLKLMTKAYEAMLHTPMAKTYPETRDHRIPRADMEAFLRHFGQEDQQKILEILEKGQYIPQEILNYNVLKSNMKG